MPRVTSSRSIAVALSFLSAIVCATTPIQAQTLPLASGTDLTLPPDMRPGVQMQAGALPAKEKKAHHAGRRHAAAAPAVDPPTTPAPSRAAQPDEHPVDLGVTMRGGSGTARVYAPTGDSEVLQESGSAFGAGMKFGF